MWYNKIYISYVCEFNFLVSVVRGLQIKSRVVSVECVSELVLPPQVVDERELNQRGEDERCARAHPDVDSLESKKERKQLVEKFRKKIGINVFHSIFSHLDI